MFLFLFLQMHYLDLKEYKVLAACYNGRGVNTAEVQSSLMAVQMVLMSTLGGAEQ